MKGDGQIKTGIAIRPKFMPSSPSVSRKCGLLSKHNKYTSFTTKNMRNIDRFRLVYKTRPYGTPKQPLSFIVIIIIIIFYTPGSIDPRG